MAFKSVKLGTVLAIAAFIAFVTLVLLATYSTVPRSVLGWVALFVIGIPTWMALEWLGNVVLSAKAFSRMPAWARIAIGVPVFIALMVVAFFVIRIGGGIIDSF